MVTQAGIHVWTRDRVRVLDAINEVVEAEGLVRRGDGHDPDAAGHVRLLLLPSRGHWVSLYPEEGEVAVPLARALSVAAGAPTLVVGTVDDDAAVFYAAFDAAGEPLDEYHSCPDLAKDVGEDDAGADELERTRGRPERLVEAFEVTRGLEPLRDALTAARLERLRELDIDGVPDPRPVLEELREALALPDLEEGFDELWGGALEAGLDVHHLVYDRPRAGRMQVARGWLKGKLRRG